MENVVSKMIDRGCSPRLRPSACGPCCPKARRSKTRYWRRTESARKATALPRRDVRRPVRRAREEPADERRSWPSSPPGCWCGTASAARESRTASRSSPPAASSTPPRSTSCACQRQRRLARRSRRPAEIDRALKRMLGVGADTLQSLGQPRPTRSQVIETDEDDDLDLAAAAAGRVDHQVRQPDPDRGHRIAGDRRPRRAVREPAPPPLPHRRRAGRGEHPAAASASSTRRSSRASRSSATWTSPRSACRRTAASAEDRRPRDRPARHRSSR